MGMGGSKGMAWLSGPLGILGESGGLRKLLDPVPDTAVVTVGGRLKAPDAAWSSTVCTLQHKRVGCMDVAVPDAAVVTLGEGG
eukprot:1141969-Pelagomonas_calceolata.AAC.4